MARSTDSSGDVSRGTERKAQLPERFGKRGNEKEDAWAELWKQEEKEVERRLKAFGGSIKRPKV